jgi:hypothetical protein
MRLAHYFIVLLFVLVLSACSDGTSSSTAIGSSDIACADAMNKEIPCK